LHENSNNYFPSFTSPKGKTVIINGLKQCPEVSSKNRSLIECFCR